MHSKISGALQGKYGQEMTNSDLVVKLRLKLSWFKGYDHKSTIFDKLREHFMDSTILTSHGHMNSECLDEAKDSLDMVDRVQPHQQMLLL